jgi:hypothetical protein
MVEDFDCLSGALVQQPTALGEQRFVGFIARQRVLELVFDIGGGLLVNELAGLQIAQ